MAEGRNWAFSWFKLLQHQCYMKWTLEIMREGAAKDMNQNDV